MKRIKRNNASRQRGFTLTEIIIAMALFAFVGSGVMFALNASSKTIISANEITTAESLTRAITEYIKRCDYVSTVVATTLDAQVAIDEVGTIDVADTTGFPDTGVIQIEEELIYYEVRTGGTFTTLTRGYAGTTVAEHDSGTAVIDSPLYYDDTVHSDIYQAAGINLAGAPYYNDYTVETGIMRLDPQTDDYDDDDGLQKIFVTIRYQEHVALHTETYKVNR